MLFHDFNQNIYLIINNYFNKFEWHFKSFLYFPFKYNYIYILYAQIIQRDTHDFDYIEMFFISYINLIFLNVSE